MIKYVYRVFLIPLKMCLTVSLQNLGATIKTMYLTYQSRKDFLTLPPEGTNSVKKLLYELVLGLSVVRYLLE